MATMKILVVGDVEGEFDILFKKVKDVLDKVGPFECLFCVGSFFGANNEQWNKYRTGAVSAPIETFIIGPVRDEHVKLFPDLEGGQLCPKITYLGKLGLYRTACRIKIAYLSGLDIHAKINPACLITKNDVEQLREMCHRNVLSAYRGVDVLLTSQWPSEVTRLDSKAAYQPTSASRLVGWLITQIKPRYHFAGFEGTAYERSPFTYPDSSDEKVLTRFIALAKVQNPKKQRWLYALNVKPISSLTPMEINLQFQKTEHTPLPFSYTNNLKLCAQGKETNVFFDLNKRKSAHSSPQKRRKVEPQDCWFCLSNEKVNKHLVVSVGNSTYLALAKGALVPEHIVISTIAHCQSMLDASDDSRREVERFKTSLTDYFKSKKCFPVFFERNFRSAHMLIQVVPVPETVQDSIKESFLEIAKQHNVTLEELSPGLSKAYMTVDPGTPYFHVELPDGGQLFHLIKSSTFPLQFGREALAAEEVLNIPERTDWTVCTVSREVETEWVQRFRKGFAPYDFTLEP